jgi:Flp pilus assembly protein TadD
MKPICMGTMLLAWVLSGAVPGAQSSDVLLNLAEAELGAGRPAQAAAAARKATIVAPRLPSAWYELGRTYEAIARTAQATFATRSDEAPWRDLIDADRSLASDQLADAFVAYRSVLERLPGMVSIRDSIAAIYERTGHADWEAQERAAAATVRIDCETRQALCQFRAAQYAPALSSSLRSDDAESRYWRIRSANELASNSYKHLDDLADSSERRLARAATLAGAQHRYTEAIVEMRAAVKLTPGNPVLVLALATMEYEARDFERALAVIAPLVRASPDDPRLLRLTGLSLMKLRRVDEAVPVLQRVLSAAPLDSDVRLALALAYLQKGDNAAALPLLESEIAGDADGSVHVQLARACIGLGQRDKAAVLLEQGQALQRRVDQQRAAAAPRTILPPGSE